MTHIRTDFPYAVERINDIWITVADGTRLSATIRRPASGLPAPAILEYLPYRKDDGTLVRDQRQHDYLAGMGFACVRVDARGTGDSEGILEGEYLEEELADGEFLVDWIRDQDWCNGRVAIMGISWGGFNGLQIAARPTSRVDAVVSVASTVDRYATDVHYKGGCVLGTDMLPWSATMLCFDARPPTPSVVGDGWRDQWIDRLDRSPVFIHDWLAHQRRDDFWRHGSICEDFSAIDCPVLIVGGLADGYTDTTPKPQNPIKMAIIINIYKILLQTIILLNNHPDEVNSKAVIAHGLVNKATQYFWITLSSKASVLLLHK